MIFFSLSIFASPPFSNSCLSILASRKEENKIFFSFLTGKKKQITCWLTRESLYETKQKNSFILKNFFLCFFFFEKQKKSFDHFSKCCECFTLFNGREQEKRKNHSKFAWSFYSRDFFKHIIKRNPLKIKRRATIKDLVNRFSFFFLCNEGGINIFPSLALRWTNKNYFIILRFVCIHFSCLLIVSAFIGWTHFI